MTMGRSIDEEGDPVEVFEFFEVGEVCEGVGDD